MVNRNIMSFVKFKGAIMRVMFEFFMIASYYYMWFMPMVLALVIYKIVKDYKNNVVSRGKFVVLGVLLTLIILPIYCGFFM